MGCAGERMKLWIEKEDAFEFWLRNESDDELPFLKQKRMICLNIPAQPATGKVALPEAARPTGGDKFQQKKKN